MGEIYIHYLNLPEEVEGFARCNEDDSYSVILNAKCSHERQRGTLLHELAHIKNGDFYKDSDAVELEERMPKKIKPYHIGDGL